MTILKEFGTFEDQIDKELDITPESVKLLNSYLTVIGVDHKDTT
jgi:hypothetical protein